MFFRNTHSFQRFENPMRHYLGRCVLDAPSELAPAGPVPGSLLGTYRSHITIFGAQASFRF